MMNRKQIICLAAIAAISTAAQADEVTGPYVALQLGVADFNFDTLPELDKSAFVWSPMFGWQATRNIGFEVGYFDVKKLKYVVGSDELTYKLRGFQGAVVATAPLGESWSVFARLGGAHGTGKTKLYESGILTGYGKDTDTEFLYGGGLSAMVDGAKLRAEYARVDQSEGSVAMISFTVQWNLRSRD